VGRLSKRSFWQSLVAVLAGNAIYFCVERFLPARAQHQPYQIDWGNAGHYSTSESGHDRGACRCCRPSRPEQKIMLTIEDKYRVAA
jgi:hypothetical protein